MKEREQESSCRMCRRRLHRRKEKHGLETILKMARISRGQEGKGVDWNYLWEDYFLQVPLSPHPFPILLQWYSTWLTKQRWLPCFPPSSPIPKQTKLGLILLPLPSDPRILPSGRETRGLLSKEAELRHWEDGMLAWMEAVPHYRPPPSGIWKPSD